jgi:D-3-phosphoglycerate dehydrogenase / 2-oxoglutarate reductase
MDPALAFVSAEWPEEGHQALRRLGYGVRTGGWGLTGRALLPAALAEAAARASVLIVEVERVDEWLLDRLPGVEVVCTARDTPSNVDVEACTRRRVPVLYAPARNADSVADYVLGLILAVCRGICAADRRLRGTGWMVGNRAPYLHFRGPELARLTLGLIGYGAVGRRVAQRATNGFGMRVIHHDPDPAGEPDAGSVNEAGPADEEGSVELAALLRTADVVSLHCTNSPATTGLIDASALARMRPTSYLINTAGGAMVDEDALLSALESGGIAGAALDVYATEPLPADSPLLRCERLVLTPHLAGAASDVAGHHAEMICDDLALLAAGEPPLYCANRDGVLPITPPQYFAEMRDSAMFHEGIASRDLSRAG